MGLVVDLDGEVPRAVLVCQAYGERFLSTRLRVTGLILEPDVIEAKCLADGGMDGHPDLPLEVPRRPDQEGEAQPSGLVGVS